MIKAASPTAIRTGIGGPARAGTGASAVTGTGAGVEATLGAAGRRSLIGGIGPQSRGSP